MQPISVYDTFCPQGANVSRSPLSESFGGPIKMKVSFKSLHASLSPRDFHAGAYKLCPGIITNQLQKNRRASRPTRQYSSTWSSLYDDVCEDCTMLEEVVCRSRRLLSHRIRIEVQYAVVPINIALSARIGPVLDCCG